jgi:hypothetical protein
VYDRNGLQGAFVLQTAINALPLLLALLLLLPVWTWAERSSSSSSNADIKDLTVASKLSRTYSSDSCYIESVLSQSDSPESVIIVLCDDSLSPAGVVTPKDDTSSEPSDIPGVDDRRRYLHMDSAHDMESLRQTTAAAAEQHNVEGCQCKASADRQSDCQDLQYIDQLWLQEQQQ